MVSFDYRRRVDAQTCAWETQTVPVVDIVEDKWRRELKGHLWLMMSISRQCYASTAQQWKCQLLYKLDF
jgi:hypothetical protein